ncbi:hypothetical protein Ancab_024980 [Ancistrocladus abbreviatus]
MIISVDFAKSNWSSPLEEIYVSYCNMTGQLSQSIGLSKSLRLLDLSGNNFHGPIPPWIWNTTEVIALAFNYFTGGLPSSMNLTNLSGLTEIDIAANLLNGETPSWMFSLPSMQWLVLDSNQFNGELPLLLNQSRLSSNHSVLSLSDNQLSGTISHWLFTLPSLLSLALDKNHFTGQISTEFTSKSLYSITLSNNNLSGIVDLAMFSILPKLVNLDLSINNLSAVASKDLLHVEQLHRSDNQIYGDIPRWIQNMAKDSSDLLSLDL